MQDHHAVLAGVRGIDRGTHIAGPAAATEMSDFGAEVIKIERPPHGDPYRYLSLLPAMPAASRPYCWILTSRNERSLALNLAGEAGRRCCSGSWRRPTSSSPVTSQT